MELINTNIYIDSLENTTVDSISLGFLNNEIDMFGMNIFFNKATEQMGSTDEQELFNLFENGIKLGLFIATNQKLFK